MLVLLFTSRRTHMLPMNVRFASSFEKNVRFASSLQQIYWNRTLSMTGASAGYGSSWREISFGPWKTSPLFRALGVEWLWLLTEKSENWCCIARTNNGVNPLLRRSLRHVPSSIHPIHIGISIEPSVRVLTRLFDHLQMITVTDLGGQRRMQASRQSSCISQLQLHHRCRLAGLVGYQ